MNAGKCFWIRSKILSMHILHMFVAKLWRKLRYRYAFGRRKVLVQLLDHLQWSNYLFAEVFFFLLCDEPNQMLRSRIKLACVAEGIVFIGCFPGQIFLNFQLLTRIFSHIPFPVLVCNKQIPFPISSNPFSYRKRGQIPVPIFPFNTRTVFTIRKSIC